MASDVWHSPTRENKPKTLKNRALAGTVAAILIVTIMPTVQAAESITPGVLITTGSAGTNRMLEAFDAASMAAVDLDGDGTKEILAHNDNNNFYVFDGGSGALIAELETNHPDGWGARVLAGSAVGDLNGNGLPDIVLTNSAGWITVYEAQPVSGPQKLHFTKLWEHLLDPHNENPNYSQEMAYGEWEGFPGLDGPPFLADSNGDGRDEVFVQLDDMPGLYKLSPDGHVEWWSHTSDANAGPVVADLTGDGNLEAIYPSDGGNIHVFDAATMNHRCSFGSQSHGAWPASISISPTVGDITGDGRKEILFGVRNVHQDQNDPDWIDKSDAHHFAVRHNCTLLWQKSWSWNNPHVYMQPVPVDVTGNGKSDVVFQDWNTIGHKPGNWESTGRANLYALEGSSGNLLWRQETHTFWSNNNVAVADVTGNGEAEILVNEFDGVDGLGLYSLGGHRTGFVGGPGGWQVTKGPLVADLDGDGRLEIVLPLHRGSSSCEQNKDIGCREGALQLYHTESSATPVYDNNHRLNADVPGGGDDPGGVAPPGEWEPRFRNVRGNAWWVETEVTGSSIAGVDARVDAGSWVPLRKTSWGSWAESFHAPDGGVVQFRAVAHDGATALSECYQWTKAQTTDCPDGGGSAPPPDGDVVFLNPRGNEWWVETETDAGRPVTAVHARVDGGGWQSLQETGWGSWARSTHAPGGSVVQFRATMDDNSRVRSGCYQWTHAEPTACPGTGAEPFPVTFSNVRGNEWWVEADVHSERMLAGVHVRIDGGGWQDLRETDWGSWARSIHIDDGSTVEFRATADDGSTAHSDPYSWTP